MAESERKSTKAYAKLFAVVWWHLSPRRRDDQGRPVLAIDDWLALAAPPVSRHPVATLESFYHAASQQPGDTLDRARFTQLVATLKVEPPPEPLRYLSWQHSIQRVVRWSRPVRFLGGLEILPYEVVLTTVTVAYCIVIYQQASAFRDEAVRAWPLPAVGTFLRHGHHANIKRRSGF